MKYPWCVNARVTVIVESKGVAVCEEFPLYVQFETREEAQAVAYFLDQNRKKPIRYAEKCPRCHKYHLHKVKAK